MQQEVVNTKQHTEAASTIIGFLEQSDSLMVVFSGKHTLYSSR